VDKTLKSVTHGQCDTRPNPNSITNPNYYYYYYIHLMAFFQHNLGKPAPER